MSALAIFGISAIWLACLGVVMVWMRSLHFSQQSMRRLYGEESQTGAAPESVGLVRRWLITAGIRSPNAPTIFWTLTACSAVVALSTLVTIFSSGLAATMVRGATMAPGGVGEVFLPFVFAAPWLLALLIAFAPTLWVWRTRRQRVEEIERDLPLALDLLATMSEAGLGFDAALQRLYSTTLSERPLAMELRTFQSDQLSGRPRVQCLRRLADRIRIPSFSTFISAMAQAEQLGMGVAGILRRQADDLRDRRRERAIAFAMSLAVKRVVPMVVCFLPGFFVWTLGPFFAQLFQLADQLTKSRI